MCSDEKKTESLKVHTGPSLYMALAQLADQEGLALSTYLERVLARHAFGHARPKALNGEGTARPDSGRNI